MAPGGFAGRRYESISAAEQSRVAPSAAGGWGGGYKYSAFYHSAICADSRVVKGINILCHQNCNPGDLGSIQLSLAAAMQRDFASVVSSESLYIPDYLYHVVPECAPTQRLRVPSTWPAGLQRVGKEVLSMELLQQQPALEATQASHVSVLLIDGDYLAYRAWLAHWTSRSRSATLEGRIACFARPLGAQGPSWCHADRLRVGSTALS